MIFLPSYVKFGTTLFWFKLSEWIFFNLVCLKITVFNLTNHEQCALFFRENENFGFQPTKYANQHRNGKCISSFSILKFWPTKRTVSIDGLLQFHTQSEMQQTAPDPSSTCPTNLNSARKNEPKAMLSSEKHENRLNSTIPLPPYN